MDSSETTQSLLHRAFQEHQAGRVEQAQQFYRQILEIDPNHVDALQLSGTLAHDSGRYETAVELISRAISLRPGIAEFHHNIGVSYQALNDEQQAANHYRKAIEINPNYAEALNNLGALQQERGQIDAAIECFKQAVALQPDSDSAHYNLASCYRMLGWVDLSEKHCCAALAANPVYIDAQLMHAGHLLAASQFQSGWQTYEWRRYQDTDWFIDDHPIALAQWTGAPGERVLVYPEQGLGDEIMFASCIPDLCEIARQCVLLCTPRLVPMFRRSFPVAQVFSVAETTEPGRIADYKISTASLAGFFRPDSASFPSSPRYLFADPEREFFWREKLEQFASTIRVGISWRGGKDSMEQSLRSISLALWHRLFAVDGVTVINLQYGNHEQEIGAFRAEFGDKLVTFAEIDPLKDIEEFAALIRNLDLVISIDNSTVHLAGALGTPTWVLLPAGPNWRWSRQGAKCLWYPSVRLFRCDAGETGQWEQVLCRVCDALDQFSAAGGRIQTIDSTSDFEPTAKIESKREASPAQPVSGASKRSNVVLVNDTRAWNHWGCSCGSLAIHSQLSHLGCTVDSIPIRRTSELNPLPQTVEDFQRQAFAQQFTAGNRDLLDRIRGADIVVINGEDTLHGLSSSSLSLLFLAYFAKTELGKKVHLINHSCFPDDRAEAGENLAHYIYQKVYSELDFVAAREMISARLLNQLSLKTMIAFDCLPLFLRRSDLSKTRNNSDIILISGSTCWQNAAVTALQYLIDRLSDQGYRIGFLIGAAAYPAADDYQLIKSLHQRCGSRFCVINARSEFEWLNLIRSARLLVSGRFHHSIAAGFLNTPFIAMQSNTPKVDALMEMFRLDIPLSIHDNNLGKRLLEQATGLLRQPSSGLVDRELLTYLEELALNNFAGLA